nr:Cholix toxin [Paraburkholderia busanensis]
MKISPNTNAHPSASTEGTAAEHRSPAELRSQYGLERNTFQDKSGYADGQLSGLLDLRNQRHQPGVPTLASKPRIPTITVGGQTKPKAKEAEDLHAGLAPSTPNAIAHMKANLKAGATPEKVANAHAALVQDGYKFMGYHGTNKLGSDAMLEGMDPAKIGSGGGTDKGHGFYVAKHPNYAQDYADSAAHDPDQVDMRSGKAKPYDGDQGVEQVVRVYAKNTEGMRHQKDVAWGVESSSGDPNHDKRLAADDTSAAGLESSAKLSEMVVAPHHFGNLATIPSANPQAEKTSLDSNGRAKWPSHEI